VNKPVIPPALICRCWLR